MNKIVITTIYTSPDLKYKGGVEFDCGFGEIIFIKEISNIIVTKGVSTKDISFAMSESIRINNTGLSIYHQYVEDIIL